MDLNRLRNAFKPASASAATPAPAPAPTPVDPLDARRVEYRDRKTAAEARKYERRALDRVEELERTIAGYERFTAEPLRPVVPVRMHNGLRPAAAVALLSDVHAEERVVRTDAINNEYTLAIAQHRVARFFGGVAWLTRAAQRDFAIDTLVLWLGGDLVSGNIHEENAETGALPPMAAALVVRDWLVAGIRELLTALPDVSLVIPCSYGNHGRTTKTMRATTGYGHNVEWLLYQMLGHAFATEPRVHVHVTHDEMQYITVMDRTLAFHHGHRIRYHGGIGGVTVPAIKAAHRWSQWRDVDYYHFGHYHQRIDLGQIAFNGSVVGPSPYSFAIGATPEVPQQSFYVLDAKRGKTMASPIWVAE